MIVTLRVFLSRRPRHTIFIMRMTWLRYGCAGLYVFAALALGTALLVQPETAPEQASSGLVTAQSTLQNSPVFYLAQNQSPRP